MWRCCFSWERGLPSVSESRLRGGAILSSWRGRARARLPPRNLQPPPWPDAEPGNRISAALQAWSEAAPRPLVVDEIDALQDEALVSVLRHSAKVIRIALAIFRGR